MLIVFFFTYIGIDSCADQRKLDESNAVCRGVVLSRTQTTKGTRTKCEFIVNGRKYRGNSGPSNAGRARVGDSVYVKYIEEDPSLNQVMYSTEYSYPPNKNAVKNVILIFVGFVVGGLVGFYIDYRIKKLIISLKCPIISIK